MLSRPLCALLLLFCLWSAHAESDNSVRLQDYLAHLVAQGTPLLYSDDLVTPDLWISVPPSNSDAIALLQAELPLHGLTLDAGPGGIWLVVRAPQVSTPVPERKVPSPPLPQRPQTVEQIIVSASRHTLAATTSTSSHRFNGEYLDLLPGLAQEPLRVTQLLPGSVSGGLSARSYVRGGDLNEQLVILDGLRLYEPYHLKDFRTPASLINGAAIGEIEYYAGGFPARYGDRMSSVIDIRLRTVDAPLRIEAELSTLNTTLFAAGRSASGESDWLVSARRSNLDLILNALDSDYGTPRYGELLFHAGHQIAPAHRLSGNLLIARDKIDLFYPQEEVADARYANAYVWFKLDSQWSRATARTLVSHTDIDNRRTGQVNIPNQVSGALDDERAYRISELQQHWQWQENDSLSFNGGFNLRRLEANYRYRSDTTVDPLFEAVADVVTSGQRMIDVTPAGNQYAVYAGFRGRFSRWLFDGGLRWDVQTYTTAADDEQISPRLSLMYEHSDRSQWRASWGRYYQAQEVNELSVDAGLTGFSPAQRSEHAIVTFTHLFESNLETRVELYRKSIRSNQPRFENQFNPLVLLPDLRPDRVRVDARSTLTRGIELTVSKERADNSRWWLSYAWSQAYDTTDQGKIARSWDQRHSLKAGALIRRGPWNFSATLDAHSGWPRTQLDAINTQAGPSLVAGVRNRTRFPDFQRLDLRVSRDIALPSGSLMSYLELSNALNRDNPCCTRYTLEDGTLISDQRNWLPIVATLGVRWTY